MVCVSTVSVVYNLRMDHYGARKHRNIENVILYHKYYFLTPMESVLTTFQVKWSILADGLPIQLKKPTSDPLTPEVFKTFEQAGNSDFDLLFLIF